MNAGQFDRRITLEKKSVVQDDDYGTKIVTWTPFASRIAAQVQDVLPSKSETEQQGIRIATRPARIRIRYRSGVTSDMRVVIHGTTDRTLQIIGGPAEIGRREVTEIMAAEFSTSGAAP